MAKHGIYRVSPKYPKAEQKAALLAAGVPEGFIFDWAGWDQDVRTFRRGETLHVHGLDRLGEDFDDVIELLEEAVKRGVKILNVETGRYADPGPTADLIVMSRRLIGERRRPSDAKIKAGAKKRTGRRVKWAIPFNVAAKHWRDLGIATNEDAADKITKLNKAAGGKTITIAMLQKKFPGGSGRPSGWRRGQKRSD